MWSWCDGAGWIHGNSFFGKVQGLGQIHGGCFSPIGGISLRFQGKDGKICCLGRTPGNIFLGPSDYWVFFISGG